MNRRWEFTDLEFFALWEGTQDGVLPSPFFFTSDIPLYRDFLAAKQHALQRLRDRLGYTADDLLGIMTRPDLRIAVRGTNEENPRLRIRLLAVRRADRGLLISQQPGETLEDSGGFTVVEQHASELPRMIVSGLPTAPAGKRGEVVLTDIAEHAADYDYTYSRPVHRAADDEVQRSAGEFRRVDTDSVGMIDICQGVSVFGPSGISRYRSGWRDLAGDGRYLVTPGPPAVATPVDRRRMVEALDRVIADVLRTMKDEPVR
ncbi:ESX secretion-associated protein EspG [Nocardia sp. NBC_00416]|uniref:ESX secretion-associated protein EspG n=1 Tax=Nocardia sp. NBC_00416 TaxID=2975991 RepID=UPI002E21C37F